VGIKEKRAKMREEFRCEILNEARALFVQDGYEKFSIRKLAEKIGYTPTTIYRYFKDKDDLLYEICEDVAEHFFENLKHVQALYGNPLDALRHSMLCHIAFGLDNPNHYKVFFFMNENVYGSHEHFLEQKTIARDTYLMFRDLVQQCIDAGQLRNSNIEVLTQALGSAVHGSITWQIFGRAIPKVDRNVLAETLVDGLLKGFQA
jgi:AcrR family transcriptional regulator